MRTSKTRKISRKFATRVRYRGKDRHVIAELDLDAGTIRVRFEGCRARKAYIAADLATFKPHTPQLGLNL